MNKINEITKNNKQFNELQALLEERNSKLIAKLKRMSEIHDNVARKILIGRSHEDYMNYKNHINDNKHNDLFINDNIEIVNVTDKNVTISFTVKDTGYYYRGHTKQFKGGTYTKTIPLFYLSIDDRALAKRARVKVYNYLMNIENMTMRDLHQSDLAAEAEINNLEGQIHKLRRRIDDRKKQMTHHNYLRKSYELWYYNKAFGNNLPTKDRGTNQIGRAHV